MIVGLVANSYFSIQFIKQQTNRSTHCLARAACSHASPFISFSIPSILDNILLVGLFIS